MSDALFTNSYRCPPTLAQSFKIAAGVVATGVFGLLALSTLLIGEKPLVFLPETKYARAKALLVKGTKGIYQLSEEVVCGDLVVAEVVSEKILPCHVTKAEALQWLNEKEQGWIRRKRKPNPHAFEFEKHFQLPAASDVIIPAVIEIAQPAVAAIGSMALETPIELAPPLWVKKPRRITI